MRKDDRPLLKILESMPVPCVISSPATAKVIWANSRTLQMYRVEDPSYVLDKSLLDFIEPADLSHALTDLATVVAGKTPAPFTYRLRRFNGERAAGLISSVPMWFRGQLAMLSFITDVSERERMLDRTAESEERYRTLVESMPNGVAVVLDGIIVFANRALAEALGHASPEDLLDRPARQIVAKDSRRSLDGAVKQACETGECARRMEVALMDANGDAVSADTTVAAVRWDGVPAAQLLFEFTPATG